MRVVIAFDSFKGSLTSREAAEAARAGVLRAVGDANVRIFPIGDGGEGTMEALCDALSATKKEVTVHDPLMRPIRATYALGTDGVAVLEMAAASGLTLLSEEERDPLYTTTFGFGEMLLDAYRAGARSFLLAIGGSATNDAGVGMLTALGYRFLKRDGTPISHGAIGLNDLFRIDTSNAVDFSDCTLRVICDVDNPLCGARGASAVYAKQKGAKDSDILQMDKWHHNFATLTKTLFFDANEAHPGAGAAGGLGFALNAFLHATLKSGIETVMELLKLEEAIRDSTLVLTGEGRIDRQSAMGKVLSGICRAAKGHTKVLAFCGAVGEGAEECLKLPLEAYHCITPTGMDAKTAMNREVAAKNLCERVFEALSNLG